MSVVSKKLDRMEYLVSENISAPHCFTTRSGGVSTGHLESLNLSVSRGDDPANVAENFRRLGSVLGFSPEDVVKPYQIHSDIVLQVGRQHRGMGLLAPSPIEADALITNEPGVALVVSTADCTPILLHDPITGAIGAVHAGWRGTAKGIVAKTVDTMVQNFGCKPENIRAAIGPNIGFCCFETDGDVPAAMIDAFGPEAKDSIRQKGEKYYVDLKELNARWLRRRGITHIAISNECTCCNPHRFWSHRATGGIRGSQGAIILCKEGSL